MGCSEGDDARSHGVGRGALGETGTHGQGVPGGRPFRGVELDDEAVHGADALQGQCLGGCFEIGRVRGRISQHDRRGVDHQHPVVRIIGQSADGRSAATGIVHLVARAQAVGRGKHDAEIAGIDIAGIEIEDGRRIGERIEERDLDGPDRHVPENFLDGDVAAACVGGDDAPFEARQQGLLGADPRASVKLHVGGVDDHARCVRHALNGTVRRDDRRAGLVENTPLQGDILARYDLDLRRVVAAEFHLDGVIRGDGVGTDVLDRLRHDHFRIGLVHRHIDPERYPDISDKGNPYVSAVIDPFPECRVLLIRIHILEGDTDGILNVVKLRIWDLRHNPKLYSIIYVLIYNIIK